MIPKKKIGTLAKVAEDFLDKVDLHGVKRAAWLKGYEHGIVATLILDEIESADQIDLTDIKTLDEFEREADRTEKRRLFDWLMGIGAHHE